MGHVQKDERLSSLFSFRIEDLREALESGNETTLVEYLERVRWPEGVRCVVDGCGSADTVLVGSTRGTKTTRRMWRCRKCQKQFSVRYGTVMAEVQGPLLAWGWSMESVLGRRPSAVDHVVEKTGVARSRARALVDAVRDELGSPSQKWWHTASRYRRHLAAAVATVALVALGWTVAKNVGDPAVALAESTVQDPLVDHWWSDGQMRVVETERRPGESAEEHQQRHFEMTSAMKSAFPRDEQ